MPRSDLRTNLRAPLLILGFAAACTACVPDGPGSAARVREPIVVGEGMTRTVTVGPVGTTGEPLSAAAVDHRIAAGAWRLPDGSVEVTVAGLRPGDSGTRLTTGAGGATRNLRVRVEPSPPLGVSREDLGRLFDRIVALTEEREAFSPVKEAALGYLPLEAMRALRPEFVGATTEAELFFALTKLSAARRDRHLAVRPVPGGIHFFDRPPVRLRAAVRILPDFSDPETPAFFVAAVGAGVEGLRPGDLVVAVNGRSIPEIVEEFRWWVRHSSQNGFLWHLAADLPWLLPGAPPSLYSGGLTLTVEDGSGRRSGVTLPYGDPRTHTPEETPPAFPGFEAVLARPNFEVFVNRGERLVLLSWLDFGPGLIDDVPALMEVAAEEELLDHDLIIDVRGSSGGSRGAFAIQRLVSRPFRTTFGNVRLSEAGTALIERFQRRAVDPEAPEILGLDPGGRWLVEWARADAAEAIRRGDDYTAPTPFKLAHLPRDSDGILQPAPVHFRGRAAILGGPHGGSHLDQFVSMFADNDLAILVGMPTGGYSNTWEHEEVLRFPGTDRPMAEFAWNIGHTLRPNGEILEGNPALPHIPIPLTRENFRSWDRILMREATQALRRR